MALALPLPLTLTLPLALSLLLPLFLSSDRAILALIQFVFFKLILISVDLKLRTFL